jgi:hypothetical protein
MYALEAAFLLLMIAWLIVTNTTRATPRRERQAVRRRRGRDRFGVRRRRSAPSHDSGGAGLRRSLVPSAQARPLARRDSSRGVRRRVGLLAVSAVIALALPIVTLPAPDGPHAVGVTS